MSSEDSGVTTVSLSSSDSSESLDGSDYGSFQVNPENIRVFLRIKNGYQFHNLYEIHGNTLISKIPPGSHCLRNVKENDTMKRLYTFTEILPPETTQTDLFNLIVKPKLLDFINGQNSTLLTYGASGSGKTYTVIGTDTEPGVVPRSLEYLFRTLPQLSKTPRAKPMPTGDVSLLTEVECKREKQVCRSLLNASCSSMDRSQHARTYSAMQQRLSNEPVADLEDHPGVSISVWVSFVEIYNEHIYDLLQLDPPRGQQRPKLRLGMTNGQAYIKNLTNINVTSGQEAYQILQYGIHNLNYAPTQLNKHSSRSHSIFTIKLVQVSEIDGGTFISCFNFCDLAGSERSKKTQNVGERLKESNNINSSLLVLGRCIAAVRNSQKMNDHKLVPFRESKLTQLFQRALSGFEDIAMIVTISPSREMFDESQHVLNFSAVAKDIAIERRPDPVLRKKNRFSQLVEEQSGVSEAMSDYDVDYYKNALLILQEELQNQKNEYEINQQVNMDFLRQEYEKIFSTTEEDLKRRMEKSEAALKTKYEVKMEMMKLKYERRIQELESNYDVIEIPSSDDEEESKVNKKAKELAETKEALAQGVTDFIELKTKYEALQEENLELRKKFIELESECEMYKAQLNVYSEEKSSESEHEGEEGSEGLIKKSFFADVQEGLEKTV